jgi:addiction module RelE/StbE family toxin
MRIFWTTSAIRDLTGIFDYLALRDPDTALHTDTIIREAVERLEEFPHRGRPGKREGTRELIVRGLAYLVIYTAGESRVTILRILHAAQDWSGRR